MTLADAITRVYELLAEPSTNNGRLNASGDNALITRYLNDGYQRFCRETNCLNREASIDIVSGTSIYSLPNDLISIKSAIYQTITTLSVVVSGGTPTVTASSTYRDINIISEYEAMNAYGNAFIKNNTTGTPVELWICKQSASASALPSLQLFYTPVLPSPVVVTEGNTVTTTTTTAKLLLQIRCFPVATPGTGQYGIVTSGQSFLLRPEVDEAPVFYAAARLGMTILIDDPAAAARAQTAMQLWQEAIDTMKAQTVYG